MRKVKKWSKGIAMAAVLLLLTLTVRMDVAYGAIGIDTTQKCSITFDLSGVDKLVFPNESGGYGEQTPGTGENPGESGGEKPGGETPGESDGEKPGGETPGGSDEQKPGGETPGGSGEEKPGGETPGGSGEQKPEQPSITQTSPGFEELLGLKIKVDVYKVADVNVSGKYVAPTEGAAPVSKELYNALQGNLGSVSSQTTADEWLSMAECAMEIVDGKENPQSTAHTTLNDPTAGEGMTIDNLSTGLYLVTAHDVESAQYIYSFIPYLVSLPGNNYGQDGANDDWIYEVEVSLKPSREPRYGDLEIQKTLKTFNSTLGGATCIFRIEAEKDGIVYSDVKSIVFDGAGTKSITIAKKIPAGAVVTITEVYSGASYEIISDPEKTQTIIADEAVSVDFTNDYDERLNGGTSVVNHFTDKAAGDTNPDNTDPDNTNPENRTPVWEGEQLKDSSAEPQNPKGGAAADEE